MSLLAIVHEDTELLVLDKPADLVCYPSKDGEQSSLIGRVRLYLGTGTRPHLINRLDRETSGLVLVAKTEQAARELRRLWSSRAVHKRYAALVHGHVAADNGSIEAPLGKDATSRVAIKDCVRADGVTARTDFEVVSRVRHDGRDFTHLKLGLHTGRKHQIRIHLAHIKHPIVGDKLYGGDEDLYLALVERRLTAKQRARLILPTHALHAETLDFVWQGSARRFHCPAPAWLGR
jgi:23S rRNA pseudouridine1911/1915/1917 synthase